MSKKSKFTEAYEPDTRCPKTIKSNDTISLLTSVMHNYTSMDNYISMGK